MDISKKMKCIVVGLAGVFAAGLSLVAYGQSAKEDRELPLHAYLIPERTPYCVGSPVTLRFVVKNLGKDPVQLTVPLPIPIEAIKFDSVQSRKKPRWLVEPFVARPGQLLDLPSDKTVLIEGSGAVFLALPLYRYLTFDEPGEYLLSFQPGSMRVKIGEKTKEWKPSVQLSINVVAAGPPESAGATVILIPAEKSDNGLPTLTWVLRPPKEFAMDEPSTGEGNCRIVLRDAKGKLLQEMFWQTRGERPESAGLWTRPLAWDIPLSRTSFGLPGKFFPSPGVYTIETSYRTFVEDKTGRQLSGFKDLFIPEIPQSGMEDLVQEHREAVRFIQETGDFQKAQAGDLNPKRGRWLAFNTKFNLEISLELWRKIQEAESMILRSGSSSPKHDR